jgi:curli biogenesis system outer membrane secretion channel CsgG
MTMKIKLITIFLCINFVYGCSIFKPNKTVKSTGYVTENTSIYSDSLKCLGGLIEESHQAFKVRASVGLIQDKTGKKEGFDQPLLTQSASEMALTALARTNAMKLVATTDAKDLLQYNFLGVSGFDQNKLALITNGNIGSTLSSDFFVTGSISEYNENLKSRNWGLNFFRKLLDTSLSGENKVLSIAMDLRIVGPTTGSILTNDKNELLTISLQNSIVTRGYNGSIFRVFSNSGAGVDYAVKISDPRHLAVREIVEKGILILIGKLYDVAWQKCDKPAIPENMNLGGSIAKSFEEKDFIQVQKVLETTKLNKPVKWKQSKVVKYSMTPTKTFRKRTKLCRNYEINMIKDDEKQNFKGVACREAHGLWKAVDKKFDS